MKQLLCTLCFLCLLSSAFGQNKKQSKAGTRQPKADTVVVHAMRIDFASSNSGFYIPKKIAWHPPVNRPFVIVMDNINRGCYRIDIVAKDSLIATSNVTFPLEQLATPTTAAANAVDSKSSVASVLDKVADKLDAVKEAIQPHADENSKVSKADLQKQEQTSRALANYTITMDSLSVEHNTELVKNGGDLKKAVESQVVSSIQPKDTARFAPMAKTVYVNLKTLFNEARSRKKILLRIADSITAEVSEINRNLYAMKNQLLTAQGFKNYNQDTEVCSKLRTQLRLAQSTYLPVASIKTDMQAWHKTAKTYFIDTSFKLVDDAMIGNLEALYANLKIDSLMQTLDRNDLALRYLKSESFYHYTSPPITPKGDILTVKINVTLKDTGNNQLLDNHKTYDLFFYTKHRFRFDFSTGIGVVQHLFDRSYRTEAFASPGHSADMPDSVTIRDNAKGQTWTPIICGLLHASVDLGAAIKPAATLGLSLNTATFDLSTIMIGGSLILGRSDRFIISGGWALKKVAQLSSSYEVDKAYAKSSVGETVPTQSVFKGSTFLCFSYNLTNQQSQK